MKTIPRTPFAFGLFATRPYWPWAVGALFAVTLGSTLDGLLNLLLKTLIDSILLTMETTVRDMRDVRYWATVYVAVTLVTGCIWRMSGFCGMRWMTYARTNGYTTLFQYLTHHSSNYFNNRFAGALTNKISNVAEGVDKIMQNILWQFLPLVITIIVGFYTAAQANILFSLILAGWTILYIGINLALVFGKRKHAIAFAENVSKMRGTMVDSASNISAVHQNAHQEYEMAHLQTYMGEYERSGIRNWFYSEWILVTGNVMQALFMGVVFWVLIRLLEQSLITVGDVVMIIGLMLQLIRQIFAIGNEMNRFTDFYSQAKEGLNELLVPHEIVDIQEAEHLAVHEGKVEFRDVTFSYGNQTVFDHFNLLIQPGQKVGLVGHSGAGKTSLTSILLRQYDIQHGDILIDDQNIGRITQKSLRHQIALVPQDTSLFHRTIRENIRYGRLDATDDDVLAAAKMAQADAFILKTAKGYDTLVGERGVKLSGGQRQRIAIARAILKNAPILVLDEATSALDSESETAIQQALQQLMQGKTVLAIAHRLSTLRMMDRIIVLDKGVVLEDGNHEELIAKKGIYARLWESQVRGFIQE
ncbi:ABC transporter ATP-binding protein/permease [Candidatus Peribacteria bacterium]|nr:MAG: ABC transporter ATP-binding protein/permease [Candidatus Peribacteria bacterium]